MTRSKLEIASEQRLEIGEDRRVRVRVQPMAPVIDANTGDLETRSESADPGFSFEHRDRPTGSGERACRAEARGSRAKHDDIDIGTDTTSGALGRPGALGFRAVGRSDAAHMVAVAARPPNTTTGVFTLTATRSPMWNSASGRSRARTRSPVSSRTSTN